MSAFIQVAEKEREAIVAWLRRQAEELEGWPKFVLLDRANEIERGDHLIDANNVRP